MEVPDIMIAVDEIFTSASISGGPASTFTIPKVTGSSPSYVAVLFSSILVTSTAAPTSVTYGGVAMTVESHTPSFGNTLFLATLASPPAGAQALAFNYASSDFYEVKATAITLTGAVLSAASTFADFDVNSPVVNISKAATSLIFGMLWYNGDMTPDGIEFIGPGTEVYRDFNQAWGTQGPSEGSGSIDWQLHDFTGDYYPIACVSLGVEILEIPESVLADPICLMVGA